ncbi:maleylpyruvate isomerase family mycothiol-dependent enzyme [Mycobacterium hodleri]|uniref:maleylpyruvate isomerase family mycothiol-dependent enzyme n=1 Tax=Mycolicibacterium hodleri TaxID=49897 RepID=UPI0021F3C40A|nr:maleylpyruvate isomerase family mycothiol-dependent enzyme [Mycolicibacterium hodleri]MCV7134951.1 maleylpyruvate isomerase family mycothiol-dependent enzyme [Mycolicibacterium hodleri]
MNDDELFGETTAQRASLVQLLDGLPEPQWDAPSLCAGWRIREVVAHITMPYRYSVAAILAAMLRARGKFDVAADGLARRDTADRSSAALLEDLRRNVAHRWTPPRGGQLGALSHDVIHGLDMTEAIVLQPVSPPDRIAEVLGGAKLAKAFKVNLSGRRLIATDADCAVGEGRHIDLPAKEILLVVTGRRPVPMDR